MREAPRDIRMEESSRILDGVITEHVIYEYLSRLQGPAPSTTVLHTRTPLLKELVLEAGVHADDFAVRFLGTRSPAVLLTIPQSLWFSAHADTISYLFPSPTNELQSAILQNSAHRPTYAREFPAAVLRWNPRLQGYETISEGIIGSHVKKEDPDHKVLESTPYYRASVKPKTGFEPSDRVVYTPTLALQNGLVVGNMDNAAGLAVCLASLKGLNAIAQHRRISLNDLGIGFVFPDSEEGLEHDPAYFARGARALIHRAGFERRLPARVVNVDGHDTNDPQPVARLAAYVSKNKGPVVPPDVYAEFRDFLDSLAPYGVMYRRTEEGAGVSRSDDAAYMEVMEEVLSFGYDVRDPHFNDGQPTSNLQGLVQTAKAVALMATGMPK